MRCFGEEISKQEGLDLIRKYGYIIQDIKNPTEEVELESLKIIKYNIRHLNLDNRNREFLIKCLVILEKKENDLEYLKFLKNIKTGQIQNNLKTR